MGIPSIRKYLHHTSHATIETTEIHTSKNQLDLLIVPHLPITKIILRRLQVYNLDTIPKYIDFLSFHLFFIFDLVNLGAST